jgi:hypothetical protein
MMPQLTILATSLFVMSAPMVGASPLTNHLDSKQWLAYDDRVACRGADVFERRFQTRLASDGLDWSFPLSSNPFWLSIVSAGEDCNPQEWGDFASGFETGDSARFDYSFSRFNRADYSISPTTYLGLGIHRFDYSTFATTELLALELRTGSLPANESLFAPQIPVDEVQPELTPLSGDAAAKALSRAWKRATTQLPSLDALTILTAHWAHETAAGASMYNYNFGGIKGRGPDGISCLRGASEGFGFRTRLVRDRFRAYPNAASGADDYLSLLLRRYPMAIEAAERGDVSEFVAALHRGRYFTGSEQDYVQSLGKYVTRAGEWALSVLGGVRSIQSPSQAVLTDPPAIERSELHWTDAD